MVDSLARAQRDLLEGASDEARVKLREWELPEALNVRRCSSPRRGFAQANVATRLLLLGFRQGRRIYPPDIPACSR